MITVLVFFIVLGVLVLVHELGHFIAAKKNGILVEEFGIGLPPRIWGIKIGETLYSINLLPFGGFNKLYGEEYQELEGKIIDEKLKTRAFSYQKPLQKTAVIIAGVIGNFLLGWVLISYLFTQGVPVPTNKVYVEQVQKSTPAAKIGIQENDLILKIIKDKEYIISSPEDLINLTKKFSGVPITIFIQRNNKVKEFSLTPRKKPHAGQGSLGIVITSYMVKKYHWYEAPYFGLIESTKMTATIAKELGKICIKFLLLQKPNVDVTGPIGIARYTGKALKIGNNALLELVALLSLNLAVLNILPFPALDGGRLVFVYYEWITKKKVNKKVEQYVNLTGMIILLSFAIIISVNDIVKFFK